jgi:PAS domain S-box-containing protein/putative nucleotidyltransferase with HDIG domain
MEKVKCSKTAAFPLSQENYRQLLEDMPLLICCFDLDGIIYFVNNAYCEYFGRDRSAFLGKNIFEIIEKEEEKAYLENTLSMLTPENPVCESEHFLTMGNGAIRHQLWVDRAVFDAEGNLQGYQAIGRDRTDRKRTEDKLRQIQTMVEHSPVVFLRWSAREGWPVEYVSSNVSRYGYSPEELTDGGRCWTSFTHPDDMELIRKRPKEETKSRSRYDLEYRLRCRDGSYRWVLEQGSIERDRSGNPIAFIGAVTDISDKKRFELLLSENKEHLEINLERLQKIWLNTVETLSTVVETRDPYTAGHQRRVAELSRRIACGIGMEKKKTEEIYLSALIHDIGKISTPSDILSKPGKLYTEEMSLIRRHCETGRDILAEIDFPWSIAEIVYQHHERLDGSGYPNALRGSDILPEARIIAVADVVEAMASHRPYRPSLGLEKALEEIDRGKGTLYDPDVVDACTKIFSCGDVWRGR